MPQLLEDSDLDLEPDFSIPDIAPDLSDGGQLGDVRLIPYTGGVAVEKGRPSARRAWTWDGSETVLPLAWDPSGKQHDGARRYLLKRHCTCCGNSGFRGARCPNCVKSNCPGCRASTVKDKIIPNFYLNKEDVPFPARFYGNIDCFLEFCPRRGGMGFKTEEDMRIHARSRHTMEYQVYLDSQAATDKSEVAALREQVNMLAAALMNRPTEPVAAKKPVSEAQRQAARANIQKALAARKANKDKVPG